MQQFVHMLLLALAGICFIVCVRTLVGDRSRAPLHGLFLAMLLTAFSLYGTNLVEASRAFQVAILATGALYGLFVAMAAVRSGHHTIERDLFLPAAVAVTLFIANAVANPTESYLDLFARLVPVVFWIAIGLALSAARLTAASIGAAAGLMLSIAVMASAASDPWRGCDQFKCGVFGAIFRGPFPSENYLAQLAALAVICSLGVGVGRLRFFIFLLAAVVLIAATSRTAALAAGISLVLGLTLAKAKRTTRRRMTFGLTVGGMLASVWAVSTASSGTFSNRGWIWDRSIQAVGENRLFGVGIDRWAQLQAIGLVPANNFPHSQLVLLFFAGGLVACVVYALMLWRMSRATVLSHTTAAAGLAMLTYILVSGVTEVMWNPATLDSHCVSVMLFAALRAAARTATARDESDLTGVGAGLRTPTRRKDAN